MMVALLMYSYARGEEKLAQGREDTRDGNAGAHGVELKLDPDAIVARADGREGWLREARRQLEEHRRMAADPVPRSRAERLLECERRLQENLRVEREANEAYEHYRAHGRDTQGRRLSRPPSPYEPPEIPAGKINTSSGTLNRLLIPRPPCPPTRHIH